MTTRHKIIILIKWKDDQVTAHLATSHKDAADQIAWLKDQFSENIELARVFTQTCGIKIK
jgi:hypothetical protein